MLLLLWSVIITLINVVLTEDDKFCSAKNSFDCQRILIDESLCELEQDDPRLIEAIRERFLIPPATPDEPYDFSGHCQLDKDGNPVLAAQIGVPLIVDRQLYEGRKRGGFFIEAGAFDGCTISNSLLFEMTRGWTGLLVEPNDLHFAQLGRVRRKAWSFPHCFSTSRRAEIVDFVMAGAYGGIENPENRDFDYNGPGIEGGKRTAKMQCFPVYSVLLALGNPTVDYFSLDIEGAEFPVLKTIPFDKVNISVLNVEMNRVGVVFDGREREMREFLDENGYRFYQKVAWDEIYVKKELFRVDDEL